MFGFSRKPPKPPILIRDADMMDDAELAWAVADYTQLMQNKGLFLEHELDEAAVKATVITWYCGQVDNGGHWQVLVNGGDPVTTVGQISEAVKDVGAQPFTAIVKDVDRWIKRNRKLAETLAPTSQPTPELKAFDEKFFDAGSAALVAALGRWLRGVKSLKRVDDEAYGEEMLKLLNSHPAKAEREVAATAGRLAHTVTDPLRLAIGLLLAKHTDAVARPFRLTAGRFSKNDLGETITLWRVYDADETAFDVYHGEKGALLFRPGETEPINGIAANLINGALAMAEVSHPGFTALMLVKAAGLKVALDTIAVQHFQPEPLFGGYRLFPKEGPPLMMLMDGRRGVAHLTADLEGEHLSSVAMRDVQSLVKTCRGPQGRA